MSGPLLPGFEYRRADVEGVAINYAIAGSGPPLLMLHGYPENHLMWRRVAPGLAGDHTVVLADLRGYGDSGKQYGTDVRGTALPTGHFLPEEAPDLVSDALRGFLR